MMFPVDDKKNPYRNIFNPNQPQSAPQTPPFTQPQHNPMVQQPSGLERVLDILGSPGGQTLVGAAGAGLQTYGQMRQADQMAQQNAAQFAAQMGQRQHEQDQGHQLSQAAAAAGASPLGSEQEFAQRQAIIKALLGGAQNFSVAPGDPRIAGAMGSGPQGGIRLPEGGLDPQMLERLFGDEATLASLGARQKAVGQINPGGAATDLGAMFGDAGATTSADVAAVNSMLEAQRAEETARQRELIMRAIDEDIRGEKQSKKKSGGGFLKTLGKIASVAAPIAAAPFTGGASLAAIGAGAGAANAALSGGGVKGALAGAGLGAATAGAAKAAGSPAQVLKSAAKNPALYSAILGGMR